MIFVTTSNNSINTRTDQPKWKKYANWLVKEVKLKCDVNASVTWQFLPLKITYKSWHCLPCRFQSKGIPNLLTKDIMLYDTKRGPTRSGKISEWHKGGRNRLQTLPSPQISISFQFVKTSLMNWEFGVPSWQWMTKQLTYQTNCHLNLSKKPSSLPKREPNLSRYISKLYVPPFLGNIPIFKRLFKNEFPIFSDDISLRSVREGNGRKYVTKPDIVVSSLTF